MKPLIIVKLGEAPARVAADGGNFEHWVEAGLRTQRPVRVVDPRAGAPLPAADTIAGATVTGSQFMVSERLPWSEATAGWLAELVAQQVPVLGICYGHQLLAHALGGEVGYHPGGTEAGTVPVQLTAAAAADPLLGQLPSHFDAQTMHSQTVVRLPTGAVRLAGNDFEPNHAFRAGACAWGVQFHPEFSEAVMRRYLADWSERLRRQRKDPETLLSECRETPEAAGVLRRFAQIVDRW